jgi:hypothetical protein
LTDGKLDSDFGITQFPLDNSYVAVLFRLLYHFPGFEEMSKFLDIQIEALYQSQSGVGFESDWQLVDIHAFQ